MTEIDGLYSNLKIYYRSKLDLERNQKNIENRMKLQVIHNSNTQKKTSFLEFIFMD